jgi:hypothetical protein
MVDTDPRTGIRGVASVPPPLSSKWQTTLRHALLKHIGSSTPLLAETDLQGLHYLLTEDFQDGFVLRGCTPAR